MRPGIFWRGEAVRAVHTLGGLQRPNQRSLSGKARPPGGISRQRPAGFVARRSQTHTGMLPPRASPSGRLRENRTPSYFSDRLLV
jgi:hypothetical protein